MLKLAEMLVHSKTQIVFLACFTVFNAVNGVCTNDCLDVPETKSAYPHCDNCNKYVTCSNNRATIVTCMFNLVYDITVGACNNPASSRCGKNYECAFDCAGKENGIYSHCTNCAKYVFCLNDATTVVTCSQGQHFDLVRQKCVDMILATCGTKPELAQVQQQTTSPTTSQTTTSQTTTSPTTSPTTTSPTTTTSQTTSPTTSSTTTTSQTTTSTPTTTSPTTSPTTTTQTTTTPPATTRRLIVGQCAQNCTGLPDGDYQCCLSCHYYTSCVNEIMYDARLCAADLVWDDNEKQCLQTSTTCTDESSTP